MSSRLQSFCLLLIAVCLGLGLAELAAGPTQDEVNRAIRDLGDDRFRVREEASALLWKAGKAAEPALQSALRSQDMEVAKRARSILERFRWGIYPDTPEAIVALINNYRSGDARLREQAIEGLLRQGIPGHEALLKIANAEQDASARAWFWSRVSQEIDKVLPGTILDGNLELAEQMLELSSQEDKDQAIRDYAAYLLLRGRLEPKIRDLRERVERGAEPHAVQVLSYLYRANGDLVGARWAAEKAQDPDLVDSILHEQGDWKALAARAERATQKSNRFPATDIESLGFRAAYHRLAGDGPASAKAISDIRKFAANATLEEGDRWFSVEALLVNGQYSDALALLSQAKNIQRAFELLCAQLQYRAAFELAGKAEPSIGLTVSQARVRFLLGERDEALKLFQGAAKGLAEIKDSREAMAYEELLEAEGKLGLRDLQRGHAARILSLPEKENNLGWVFHTLYPEQAQGAAVWWEFLRRKFPQEPTADTLGRLEKLVGASVDVAMLTALSAELEQSAAKQRPEERAATLGVLAGSFRAAGDDQRCLAYLKKAVATHGSSELYLRLADYHADHQEWATAADRYGQAWAKDRTQPPGPLYLQGWALKQAGKSDEGNKLIELAHLAPLANESTRYLLAETLRKRGLKDAARSERVLFLRLGEFNSEYIDEVNRLDANDALARKDYAKAADGYERFLLSCLRPSTSMVEIGSYVMVPCFIHQQRARSHLAAGRLDEALQEARQALQAMPGSIDVAIDLAPELDRRARQQDADVLFTGIFELEESICRDFPKSAHHHNAAAWLGATCRRQLDKALVHAQEAVRLAPESPAYLDTCAEIHFQRGDTGKAIGLMKKCLEIAPKRRYYQEQLKRMEAGDPRTPVPDENAPD